MLRLSNIKCFTNKKIFKIDFRTDDVCTFCEAEPETLYHNLYQCPTQGDFWTVFWILLVPFIKSTGSSLIAECYIKSTKLLNYFVIVAKLFLWDCRRNQIKPKIKGYQNKIANKYETERKLKKTITLKKIGYWALAWNQLI